MNNFISRLTKFFIDDIWRITVEDTSKVLYAVIHFFRIIILAVNGFIKHKCLGKASSLTYYTLISVVPVVAMAFGIAKGFGFKEILEREIQNQLAGHEEVVNYLLQFTTKYLDNAQGGMIAGVGFAVLLWSLMKVFGFIEDSFNDIWGVSTPRTFIRKFSDYISMMIIGLLFLISTSSMIVFVKQEVSSTFMSQVAGWVFGFVIPYFLIWLVFTMILFIMPNRRVQFKHALIGGILSGSAFQVLQYFYIHLQIGMSGYNAVYGSFAAFPLFLIWLNTSWMIVLFGAELSYAAHNVKNYEYEKDSRNISHSYRQQITLVVTHYCIQLFEKEEGAQTVEEIAFALKLPLSLVKSITDQLVKCGVLIEVINDDALEPGYFPGIDINKLTVFNVLKRINEKGTKDFLLNENQNYVRIKEHYDKITNSGVDSDANVLLKDIKQ
jgi:membrane protein